MIVTQLAEPGHEYDQYFDDGAFGHNGNLVLINPSINSPPPEDDITGTNSSSQSVYNSTAESVDECENAADPEYQPSDVSDSELSPSSPSIQLDTENIQEDQASSSSDRPPGQRQSSRLRNTAGQDYRTLNSHGRSSNL